MVTYIGIAVKAGRLPRCGTLLNVVNVVGIGLRRTDWWRVDANSHCAVELASRFPVSCLQTVSAFLVFVVVVAACFVIFLPDSKFPPGKLQANNSIL